MKLIIMRHGEAEPYQTNDKERNLTRFGKNQAEFAGRRLAEYLQSGIEKPRLENTLVSPYTRTQQTFACVSKKIETKRKIDCDMIVPEGDIEQFADYIQGVSMQDDAPETLMIISHMPFVSLFADKLCAGFNGRIFSTADILIIEYDSTSHTGTQLALLQSIS
ncbi:MAG: phosphohistidine phosphatase SixA [Pseudomonadota bacterium]